MQLSLCTTLLAICAMLEFYCCDALRLRNKLVSDDPNDLLNWCLDSSHHKTRPSREPTLYGECRSWASNACCNESTSKLGHSEVNHYKLDVNHCVGETNQKMSSKCQKFFQRDTCFFDCEPNIGPWVVKVNRTHGKERFQNVPLCASDCDAWYDACKNDYTCATNWPKNLTWRNGRSECPKGSQCRPIKDIFTSAEYFCEKIWDNSFKYTPDIEPCMKLSFDHRDNVNRRAAQYYLQTELGYEFSSSYHTNLHSWAIIASISFVCLVKHMVFGSVQ